MKVVVKALLYDARGRILVLQRSASHPHFPLHFDFPGGEVDNGERAADALAREFREETAIHVSVDDAQKVLALQKSPALQHLLYEIVSEGTPAVNVSWEHSAYVWMTPAELLAQELPDDADEYYLGALDYLRNNSRA